MNRSLRKLWTPWRIALALLTLVVAVVVAFIGWQYWLYTGGIFRTSSFNEAEWKSLNQNTNDFSCYRGGMAHDIRTNVLRAGLAKTEVKTLLGEPDFSRADVHEYILGACSGFRIDIDTLDVHFDSEGRLTKVQVVQH